MKKVFTLILLFLTVSICFAAERPRWVSMPITVYIPQYGNMSAMMKEAFDTWQKKSNNLVRFNFVRTPGEANIVVEFVDFVSHCNSADAVGCTEISTRGGEYAKSYVTIGTKEYVRKGYERVIQTRSREHIYGVMLHEAGHAIGLEHSANAGSIMYPYDLDSMQYLTNDDMNLLYRKYH